MSEQPKQATTEQAPPAEQTRRAGHPTGGGALEEWLAAERGRQANRLIPPGHRAGRILDIGCGRHPLFLINTEFAEKHGIDRVSEADDRHAAAAHGITLVNRDIESEEPLPFPDDHFDVVTMLAVFEHVDPPRLEKLLKEIRRVLKPGGVYILTTPAPWADALLRLMAKFRLISADGMREHKDAYSRPRLAGLLQLGAFGGPDIRSGYFELGMNIWVMATKAAGGDGGRSGMAVARKTMKLSIVIPVYNERGTIGELIKRVQAVQLDGVEKEIIVVDDCSTDGTREWLMTSNSPVELLVHARNQGKGAAIQSGFNAATGDILLIQDADLEYDPNDYGALIAPILRGEADAVMGSRFLRSRLRFHRRDGDPFYSHYLGNKLIIFLTNLLYGFHATDYEGCYKAFTKEVIRQTPVQATSFDFDNELICKLLRRKRRIVEVPIRYHPRLYSEGKKIRWQHGVKMVWTILKWRVTPF